MPAIPRIASTPTTRSGSPTAGSSRWRRSEPLAREHAVEQRVDPFALDANVLAKKAFALHPELLRDADRRHVARVALEKHATERFLVEREIDERTPGLRHEAFAPQRAIENEPELADLALGRLDVEPHAANHL